MAANLVGRLNTSGQALSATRTTVIGTPQNVVSLKNQLRDSISFAQISDVVEGSPVDGAIPVYDAETDKYIVQEFAPASLDGGGF